MGTISRLVTLDLLELEPCGWYPPSCPGNARQGWWWQTRCCPGLLGSQFVGVARLWDTQWPLSL